MVTLAPWGPAVPADVKATVEANSRLQGRQSASLRRPIKDNKGNVKIPAGQVGDPFVEYVRLVRPGRHQGI
jgi:hypothetical protein